MPPVPAAGCALEKLGHQDASTTSSRATPRSPSRTRRFACAAPAPAALTRRQPGAPRQDLGRRGVLVLGPPRAAQAAPRHPPRRPDRRAARRRRRHAGRDPGAPAARRQHRHGGARHGQLRPRASCAWSPRATAGPTRRRASPPPAPTSSSMRRRPIPTLAEGAGRPQLGVRHHRAPARPRQARADAGAGRRRDAAAHRRGPALRHPVRAGAQRPRDRGGRQRRRGRDGAGQPQLRLAQPGPGGAAA